MAYVISHPRTGRDLATLHDLRSVRRLVSDEPSSVRVANGKVEDGHGNVWNIRRVKDEREWRI